MVGRLLREEMRDRAMETPLRASQRIADRYAAEAIQMELERRFYPLNSENAKAVVAWQTAALRALDRTV